MSIVPLNFTDEKNISLSIKNFISDFKIVALLRKCCGKKVKGVPFLMLFTYVLTNAFRDGSFYMQQHMGKLKDSFSKNTYYRFMSNSKINWLRFTTLLSERIVNNLKRTPKIKYIFNGQCRDIKQIYAESKKRRGRSRYLLSVNVKVVHNSEIVDARIVCVRSYNNAKKWFALLCTDMNISEEEIIRIYGKRWDIEVFFKTCKSNLLLSKEYHGLSYDGLTAHVAMVFTRYMLLAVAKRDSEDDRTIGELFYIAVAELEDITYSYSMMLLTEAMLSAIQEYCQLSKAKIEELYYAALKKLPKSMMNLLQQAG